MPFNSGIGGNKVVPFFGGAQVSNPSNITAQAGAPSTNMRSANIGDIYVNTTTGTAYICVGSTGAAGGTTWAVAGGSSADINTINSNAPVAGNYTLAGTANQISKAETAGTTTFSLPAAIIAPGSIVATTTVASTTTMTAGTGLTVTTGGLTVSAGGAGITGTTNINTSGAAITTIGTGGTGAVAIGNATGNTAVTGSLTASTSLTATLGDITATNGDFVASTAAKGPKVVGTSVAGASPITNSVRAGQASFTDVINAVSFGTLTVTNSLVTASSVIIASVSCATANTILSITAIVPGSGSVAFTVRNSAAATNTAANILINFWILN